MDSEPESRRYSVSRAADKKLWKSAKTRDVPSYIVSHLSFWDSNEVEREAVESSTSTKCRDGGTGRRSGLKIRRTTNPWGFNSPSRHQPNERMFRTLVPRHPRPSPSVGCGCAAVHMPFRLPVRDLRCTRLRESSISRWSFFDL